MSDREEIHPLYWGGGGHLPMPHHHGQLGRLLQYVREDMIGELEAINAYTDHMVKALESSYHDLARLWHHILLEEKEHLAELTEILNRYDPEQQRAFRHPHSGVYSTDE